MFTLYFNNFTNSHLKILSYALPKIISEKLELFIFQNEQIKTTKMFSLQTRIIFSKPINVIRFRYTININITLKYGIYYIWLNTIS